MSKSAPSRRILEFELSRRAIPWFVSAWAGLVLLAGLSSAQTPVTVNFTGYTVSNAVFAGPCGKPNTPATPYGTSSSFSFSITNLPCDSFASATGNVTLTVSPNPSETPLTGISSGSYLNLTSPGSLFVSLSASVLFRTTSGATLNPIVEVSVLQPGPAGPSGIPATCDDTEQPGWSPNSPQITAQVSNCLLNALTANGRVFTIDATVTLKFANDRVTYPIQASFQVGANSVTFVPGSIQPNPAAGLDGSNTLHYQAAVTYQVASVPTANLVLLLYDKPGAGRVLYGTSAPVAVSRSDPQSATKTLTIDLRYPLDGNPNPNLNLPHTADKLYLVAELVDPNKNVELTETTSPAVYTFLIDLKPKIEVVQVVQDDAHHPVPLIRERNTIVRVYPMQTWAANNLAQSVTGSLQARVLDNSGNVVSTFPGPLQPAFNGSVTASNGDLPFDRASPNNSLNFLLPAAWVSQGTGAFNLELTAQLQPPAGRPVLSLANLKSISNPPFPFLASANSFIPFEVGYFRLCLNSGGAIECPSGGVSALGKPMDSLFPVSQSGVLYTELPVSSNYGKGSGPPAWAGPLDPDGRVVLLDKLDRLYHRRFQTLGVHKMAAWLPELALPLTQNSAGRTASGGAFRDGSVAWVAERASSPGSGAKSLAHEIGHTLGLHHTATVDSYPGCQLALDEDPMGVPLMDWLRNGPYTNGTIQQPGFNASPFPPVFKSPSANYDLMNYCPAPVTWISPYHYAQLYSSITSIIAANPPGHLLSPFGSGGTPPKPSDYLLVSGTVARDGSTGQLDPSEHITSMIGGQPTDPAGTYCIRQTDANHQAQDFCFTPNFYDIDGNQLSQGYFSYQVPYMPGAVRLSLLSAGGATALASYESAGAPVVIMQSPQPGATLSGVQTLEWTAKDPAQAPLTYIVDYSPDGGRTWLPVSDTVTDAPLTATQYSFDTSTLLSGSQIYFQVTALNGLDSSTTSVGPFIVSNNPSLTVGVTSLSFGNVAVGSETDLQVTLTNTGTGLLPVTSFPSDSLIFRAHSGQMFIESGGSRTLVVTFTPTTVGNFSGNIFVEGNAIHVTGSAFSQTVPTLTVAPASLDFGNVQIAHTNDLTLTLGNPGNANLIVSQLTVTDPDFQVVSPLTPIIIAPGSTATATLRFQPAKIGAASGILSILSSDPSQPLINVALTGLGGAVGNSAPQIALGGVVNAASGAPRVARGALASIYGTNFVTSGPISATSLPLPFTLGGLSVTVGGIPAPINYVQSTLINFQIPYEVPSGSVVPVEVTSGGITSNAGSVQVVDYALGIYTYQRTPSILDPIIVHLNGTLVSPSRPAVPGESLVVYANGVGKLDNPPPTGAAVAVSPLVTTVDTPVVTAGGFPVKVQFAGLTPTQLGLAQFNLQLPSALPSGTLPLSIQFPGNSPAAVVNLYVQGNLVPVPKASLSATSLAFGSLTLGQTRDLPVVISNSGNATMTVLGFLINGTSGYSVVSPGAPFTLQPGASQTVTVRFAPSAAGAASAVLSIASDDPNSPASVTLSGTGAAPASPSILVDPPSLSFGTVIFSQPKDMIVTVSNTRGGPLTVTSLTTSPGFAVTSPAAPFTLAPGSSTNVVVRFVTTTAALTSGTLVIASNDPNRPSLTVPLSGTGAPAPIPAIGVSPVSLDFGTVAVGQLADVILAIGDTGTAPLKITSITAPNGFQVVSPVITATAPLIIAPGASSNVVVRFIPPTTGITTSGLLTILSNDPSNPKVTVALTGIGGAPLIPAVSVNLPSLDFGTIFVGRTADQNLTVNNTGTGPLTISSFTVPNGFLVSTDPTPLLIPAGGSSSVTVRFAPGTVDTFTGSLVISSNDPAHPTLSVPLTGTAVPVPVLAIEVSPLTLNYGTVFIGHTKDLTITVGNGGTGVLTVSAFAPSTGFQVVSPTAPFDIASGASTTVTIRFTPTVPTVVTGSLGISSNDPANPTVTVALNGTGAIQPAQLISVNPTSLDFGSVVSGQTADLPLTVNNGGTGQLTVSSFTLPAGYLVTSPSTPFNVPAGGSATVTVRFAPTTVATVTGNLGIASNDPANPTITVPLTGTGAPAGQKTVVLQVDGGTFDFAVGYNDIGQAGAAFVNRLTPSSYPATLQSVQIYFGNRPDGLPVNTAFTLLYSPNPSGSANLSPTFFLLPEKISAVGSFSTYTLPTKTPLTINSGDFVVGFRVDNPPGINPADLDTSSPPKLRSYTAAGSVNFQSLEAASRGQFTGNFGIRATITVPQ